MFISSYLRIGGELACIGQYATAGSWEALDPGSHRDSQVNITLVYKGLSSP